MVADNSNAIVTANGNSGFQKGEYFRAELGITNTSAPVYLTVTNVAGLGTNTVLWVRHPQVAAIPEGDGYDADWNLTNDGKWNYTWDGENRLTVMQSVSAIPAAAKQRFEYSYDYQGRRIYQRQLLWDSGGSAYRVVTEERYWYDGWNLIGRSDLATGNVQAFVWGLDLSGSLQGAGGVGGLLMLDDAANGSFFYSYDGNGNVLGLMNANDGTVAAQYEYGPFGEVLKATAPMAFYNPIRFSTKFEDEGTGLSYYGYRYYNPNSGRWLSRDPMEENGGLNSYCLVENDNVDLIDLIGLAGDSRWILHWHHEAPQAIFEGSDVSPSYISTRGVSLAPGVNIHTKERGIMLRAGDHVYNGQVGTIWEEGIHPAGFNDAWKAWVDTLPKGTVITDQMLNDGIKQIYSANPQFAAIRAKGTTPEYETFQDWKNRLNAAEEGAKAETKSAMADGAIECAGYAIFIFQAGSTISDLNQQVAAANNANPWVGFDTENNLFAIGESKANDWNLFGYHHLKVTGYFVVSMTGPHKGIGFDIPEELYQELRNQFQESGQTLNGPW